MKQIRWTVGTTKALLLVNAAFWLGFGIIVITGRHPALPSSRSMQVWMGVLAFTLACALSVLTWALPRSQPAYYALIALLAALALSTVLDQFGLADLGYLVLTLAALVLLLRDRREYIPLNTPSGR